MVDDFVDLTIKSRNERRGIMGQSQDAYIEMIEKYNLDVEDLFEKG